MAGLIVMSDDFDEPLSETSWLFFRLTGDRLL
jgi:hypothetical protein